MTDKLVRIATLSKDAVDEIREIEKVTFEDIEKILKREYDLTKNPLEHFLLHLMREIFDGSFRPIYSNILFLGKGEKDRLGGEEVGRNGVYADTVSKVELYQGQVDVRSLFPLYTAVIYPQARGRLEGAFKEFGFDVGRMPRIVGR